MALPSRRLLLILLTGVALGFSLPTAARSGPARHSKVHLTVKNADIREVLTFLAREARLNLMMTPSVSGRVTVALDNVSIGDAMGVILKVGGYVSVERHNVVVVMTREEERRFW